MRAFIADIKKLSRLPHQAAFDLIRKSQTKWVTDSFVLQVSPKIPSRNERIEPLGVCVTVSKRAAKHAVDRNRMRRRLLAACYAVLPQHAKEEHDYNISARPNALTRDMVQLEKDLLWALKRLEMLK